MDARSITGPIPSGLPAGGQDPSRRRRHRIVGLAAAGGLLVVLSGCSGDPEESAVTVAQASVTAKEKALADAEAAATAAAAEFCAASSSYITALDRYGDVLNETAPTVGDVKDAGADLTKPRTETVDAGEAAVSATQEPSPRRSRSSPRRRPPWPRLRLLRPVRSHPRRRRATSPSTEPDDPPATVARVQQAEAEFATAQAGITDETPLVQAAEQFNAAAVALEMAWLQLFADIRVPDRRPAGAGGRRQCATTPRRCSRISPMRGTSKARSTASTAPRRSTRSQALQKANGLPQTGTMDKATEAALRSELEAAGGAAAQEAMASTAALQQTLTLAGYWDGPGRRPVDRRAHRRARGAPEGPRRRAHRHRGRRHDRRLQRGPRHRPGDPVTESDTGGIGPCGALR